MYTIFYILLCFPFLITAMSFHEACYKDNVVCVQQIIKNDYSILEKFDKAGFLGIHLAAYNGSLNVLKLLLEKKPELKDAIDVNGNIPFTHIFLGIHTLQQEMKEFKMIEAVLNLGFLCQVGGLSPQEQRNAHQKKYQSFKKSIELFVQKKANLTIANSKQAYWYQLPGIDEESSNYAYNLLIQDFNRQID